MKQLNILYVSVFIFGALAFTACTPTIATRGNIVEDFRMAEITPGVSSRTNVLKSLGSPTTKAPFDDNVWYYIGQKTEKKGIFDPKVVDEKIVVVAFNEEGIVEVMEEIDAERMDIPRVRRKTETGGNDVTVLEQLLGNVGKFNAPDVSATGDR
ncbi:MAG: outer membrane protein assembly factor BamE [Alphaproteobacteria bacterium]|nr:outer membrane protein assembly factor BamE [Alphaproteobacteria bacterium]NCQ88156.1 outer membrane protein assembly factor BamE [Alphaproteobacteria bacterium]NCT05337.1 outer membrane protein assembly factor BamE [Alphaproteobacteria bacterium]